MADNTDGFIPLNFQRKDKVTMVQEAWQFYEAMARRRSVREFSSEEIPEAVLDNAIRAAGSAPSGANRQPWHFVVIRKPAIKKKIREAAEAEEKTFYEKRAPQEWLEALAPLGTDASKPFLEKAPALIAIFQQQYGIDETGHKVKNYYVTESVGLATGILIAALHKAGVATLTHTPSPMNFLRTILQRPSNEKPFLLLVCGYPETGATVPDIKRKRLEEITSTF